MYNGKIAHYKDNVYIWVQITVHKKIIINVINGEKFNKFWKGINCTTSFSDHNVIQIIKTNWRLKNKNDSPKELLHQKGNKNAIRHNFLKIMKKIT